MSEKKLFELRVHGHEYKNINKLSFDVQDRLEEYSKNHGDDTITKYVQQGKNVIENFTTQQKH